MYPVQSTTMTMSLTSGVVSAQVFLLVPAPSLRWAARWLCYSDVSGFRLSQHRIFAHWVANYAFLIDLAMMTLVWSIMNNLGEIVVYLPLKGATIPYFVERFVEPSLAFAAGWNYWYAYAILVAGMYFFPLIYFHPRGHLLVTCSVVFQHLQTSFPSCCSEHSS